MVTSTPELAPEGRRPRRSRVVLVDDHPITRRGLRAVLETTADYDVCGESGSLVDALALVDALQPDVIITDLSLPDDAGQGVVRVLHRACPTAGVLVFSLHEERFFAARALGDGATGYLMKEADARDVLCGVRAVARGERYVSTRIASDLLASRRGRLARSAGELLEPFVRGLTTRQQQILCLLKGGYGTTEIARHLGVSTKTVETHCSHIKERFGLKSARELLCFAATAEPCAPAGVKGARSAASDAAADEGAGHDAHPRDGRCASGACHSGGHCR